MISSHMLGGIAIRQISQGSLQVAYFPFILSKLFTWTLAFLEAQ